jgi:metallo-beta-lactamase family protein
MATGGRVLYHLKHRAGDRRTTVLLVGFQAAGTRGRLLQEGAEEIKLYGAEVRVRARIETLDGLSAHADQEELLRWLSGFYEPPKATYLVHGEPKAATTLKEEIRKRLGREARVAEDGQSVGLAGV